MKNSNDPIGDRTRDLPACSAVPQTTALFVGPTLISKPSHLPWIREITVRIWRIYQQHNCPPHVTLRAVNGGRERSCVLLKVTSSHGIHGSVIRGISVPHDCSERWHRMTNTTKPKTMNAASMPTDNFENHSIQKSRKRLIMQQSTGVHEVTTRHLHSRVSNIQQSLGVENQKMHKYKKYNCTYNSLILRHVSTFFRSSSGSSTSNKRI